MNDGRKNDEWEDDDPDGETSTGDVDTHGPEDNGGDDETGPKHIDDEEAQDDEARDAEEDAHPEASEESDEENDGEEKESPNRIRQEGKARNRRILWIGGTVSVLVMLAMATIAILRSGREPPPEPVVEVIEEEIIEDDTAERDRLWSFEAVPPVQLVAEAEATALDFTEELARFEVRIMVTETWGTELPYRLGFSGPEVRSNAVRNRPTRDPQLNDCFGGPRRPPRAERPLTAGDTLCAFRMTWLAAPGERLSAEIVVPMTAEELTDHSVTAARTGRTPWETRNLIATIEISRGSPPRAQLMIDPQTVELRGARATTTLRVNARERALTVTEVTVADESIEILGQDCWTALDPTTEPAGCEIQIGSTANRDSRSAVQIAWTPAGIEGDLDPPAEMTVVPVRVFETAQQPVAPPRIEPRTIDFGRVLEYFEEPGVDAESATRRWVEQRGHIIITAGESPMRLVSANVRAQSARQLASIAVDATRCRETLPIGGQCDLTVGWTPYNGQRLSATIALEIRAELVAAPYRTVIELSGDVPPPEPEITPQQAARARYLALSTGSPVQSGLVTNPAHQTPTNEVRTPNFIERDYTGLGEIPVVSTRPVPHHKTVLRGTVIRAVFPQMLDSRSTTVVTAQVTQDVYAGQGRNILIPKLSKIVGLTTGEDASELDSAALEEDAGLLGVQELTNISGRMHFTWDKIIRPDGSAWQIEGRVSTQAVDGRGGVPGRYDPQEAKRWIVTALNIASNWAITALLSPPEQAQTLNINTNRETETQTNGETGAAETGDTISIGDLVQEQPNQLTPEQQAYVNARLRLSQTLAEITALHTTRPVLTIAPGTELHIVPLTDLWLRPATGHLSQEEIHVRPRTSSFFGADGTRARTREGDDGQTAGAAANAATPTDQTPRQVHSAQPPTIVRQNPNEADARTPTALGRQTIPSTGGFSVTPGGGGRITGAISATPPEATTTTPDQTTIDEGGTDLLPTPNLGGYQPPAFEPRQDTPVAPTSDAPVSEAPITEKECDPEAEDAWLWC